MSTATNGEGAAAPASDEGVASERVEIEMRSNDQRFPTMPEARVSVSSNVRKAQVRAALFRKLEPVRIGRFFLLEQLGAGAMGEIYAAYDEQLDRRVALKLVRHGSELTIKADEMLLREAQALAQVSHPNVVQIYEAGTHAGRLFIAMELIRGQTLTRWLGEVAQLPRPQRQREILRSFIAAGRGLEAAHAAGVAHRDFKPDNVLVGDDGRVRVVDFGLARAVDDHSALAGASAGAAAAGAVVPESAKRRLADFSQGETVRMDPAAETAPPSGTAPSDTAPPKLRAASRLTETGTVMGTPRFMSPEQMRGAIADQRSDQFSFCVALYHALYGEFPFAGEGLQELLGSMETGAKGLEHSVGQARLRKALRRGLSLEPARRFPSMGELLAELEPSIGRRGGWIAGAVLVLVAVVGLYFWQRSSAADPCGRAGDGMAQTWSPARQAVVHTAFLRTERWREQATAACHATFVDRVQSQQQLDRRMLCLQRDRQQAAALVNELAVGAPDAVQRAVPAAESLPQLDVCSHAETMMFGLEPPSAAVAGEVAAVREQLARAQTLEKLGRTEESLVIARKARETTERLKYPPVHAEALVAIGRALDAREVANARKEAQELYFEALDISEAARHDELAAAIWVRLILMGIRMDAGTQDAHAWWRRGDAAARRIGNSAYDQARLHHLLGEIYYRDSKYAESADEENKAIAQLSSVPGQELEMSRYYTGLANALDPQDRHDEAVRLNERALKLATEVLGPSHPYVTKLLINYGRALSKQGQIAQARSVLEGALASMPAQYRDVHVDAGRLHSFLSDLGYLEGKLDEAAEHARACLQIYQRAGAPDFLIAEAQSNLGNVELKRKNYAGAIELYNQALALRRAHLSRDHYQTGLTEGSIANALVFLARYDEALPHAVEAERVLTNGSASRAVQAWIHGVHGEALLGLHKLDAAAPLLAQALAMFDGAEDGNSAYAMWMLARALHGLGKNPERVHELAEHAHRIFASLGTPEASHRAAVEQFIKSLSPGPARGAGGATR
jgi:serine/threonine protein kinase/tetratricopeptide (TPR) repeat protein